MKALLSSRLVRFLSVALFALALTVPSLAVAQTPAAPAADAGMEFASWDTVIVGCSAGGFSAVSAALMPLLTSYAAGGPTSTSTGLLGGWFGLGCATGVWAAVIAIGTALILDAGKA